MDEDAGGFSASDPQERPEVVEQAAETIRGFTPGPWRYQEESDAYTHIVRVGERFLCQLAQDTSGEAEANARLIASAPDLLAEVERLRAEVEHWRGEAEMCKGCRASLAALNPRLDETRLQRERDELAGALAPLLDIISTTTFGDRPDVVAAVAVIDKALRKVGRL